MDATSSACLAAAVVVDGRQFGRSMARVIKSLAMRALLPLSCGSKGLATKWELSLLSSSISLDSVCRYTDDRSVG